MSGVVELVLDIATVLKMQMMRRKGQMQQTNRKQDVVLLGKRFADQTLAAMVGITQPTFFTHRALQANQEACDVVVFGPKLQKSFLRVRIVFGRSVSRS